MSENKAVESASKARQLRMHTQFLVATTGVAKPMGWAVGDPISLANVDGTIVITNLADPGVVAGRMAEYAEAAEAKTNEAAEKARVKAEAKEAKAKERAEKKEAKAAAKKLKDEEAAAAKAAAEEDDGEFELQSDEDAEAELAEDEPVVEE
jgi:hypothetical protein